LIDTSKRKILSTRSDAEFSSGESAAGGAAIRFRALTFFIWKTNTRIVLLDSERESRASEDARAEHSGLFIITTDAWMKL